MLDWQAAWRTWCDKSIAFGRVRAPPKRGETLSEQRARTIEVLTGKGRANERDITGEVVRVA